jgi:type IV pilus assembly protein PilV
MSMIRSNMRSQERGATLIEVMIALLVLAIGMLGFAGLQTQGVITGRQAYLHSTAAFLAEDMVERMRANLAQSASYSTLYTDAGQDNHCDTSSCTAAQLMGWDQYKWHSRVGSLLPNGQGQVEATQGANPYVTATIRVQYTLDTTATTASAKTYTYVMTTQIYPN